MGIRLGNRIRLELGEDVYGEQLCMFSSNTMAHMMDPDYYGKIVSNNRKYALMVLEKAFFFNAYVDMNYGNQVEFDFEEDNNE